MNCLVLKSDRYNKLLARVKSIVRKVHYGKLQFNAVHYLGLFGDKGAYQSYDVKFKSKAIHENEVSVSVVYINHKYCVTMVIGDMQGYKEYSAFDFK